MPEKPWVTKAIADLGGPSQAAKTLSKYLNLTPPMAHTTPGRWAADGCVPPRWVYAVSDLTGIDPVRLNPMFLRPPPPNTPDLDELIASGRPVLEPRGMIVTDDMADKEPSA